MALCINVAITDESTPPLRPHTTLFFSPTLLLIFLMEEDMKFLDVHEDSHLEILKRKFDIILSPSSVCTT